MKNRKRRSRTVPRQDPETEGNDARPCSAQSVQDGLQAEAGGPHVPRAGGPALALRGEDAGSRPLPRPSAGREEPASPRRHRRPRGGPRRCVLGGDAVFPEHLRVRAEAPLNVYVGRRAGGPPPRILSSATPRRKRSLYRAVEGVSESSVRPECTVTHRLTGAGGRLRAESGPTPMLGSCVSLILAH